FFWVASAIISWLVGLLVAVITTDWAYGAQREITRAFRFRRYGEELRRIQELSRNHGTAIEPQHLGIDAEVTSVGRAAEMANATRTRAGRWSNALPYLRYLTVFFFAMGAVSALIAFYQPLASSP